MENETPLVPLAFAPVTIGVRQPGTLVAKCPATLVFQPERLVVLVSAFSCDGLVLLHKFTVDGTLVLPLGEYVGGFDGPPAQEQRIPLSDGLIAEGGSLRLPKMPTMRYGHNAELTLYNDYGAPVTPRAYLLGRRV